MAAAALPSHQFSDGDAFITASEALLWGRWGIKARLQDLGSMQDRVLRVEVDGAPIGVLKVSLADRAHSADATPLEMLCHEHLGDRLVDLALPILVPGIDGRVVQTQQGASAQLMAWVPGVPMARSLHQTDAALETLGTTAGDISAALAGFDDEALHQPLEWDPRGALDTLARCLPDVVGEQGAVVRRAARALAGRLTDAVLHDLPSQAVHLDITDHNVFGWYTSTGDFHPSGVVDFGDLTWSWRISELASAVHSAIGWNCADPLAALEPVVRGFHSRAPLGDIEADCLWTVVLARAAICAAIEHVEAAGPGAGPYTRHLAELDMAVLIACLAVPPDLARTVIRRVCGMDLTAPTIGELLGSTVLVPVVDPATTRLGGNWFDVLDLPDQRADGPDPDALRLCADVEAPTGTPVYAPFAGRIVELSENAVAVEYGTGEQSLVVSVTGLQPAVTLGMDVEPGRVIGQVRQPDRGILTIQLATVPRLPAAGKVRHRSCWEALCFDPSVVLGRPASDTHANVMDRHRRNRHVAAAQPLYYRSPREIVRAQGVWMYDDTGRRYLDMVNNVAVVGHSHPRITAAATEQFQLLNTNSRFLYRAISDYAESIAATLPTDLSSIFFTNSGSEAVDLALQLSRRFTGRRDYVVLEGAYHGWTAEVFELCTMPGDRPNWRDELAPYVHVAEGPDTFRGRAGTEVGHYLTDLDDACARADGNGGLAAFISEPIMGSHGGIIPPEGYLASAYEIVRRHGGVCIADEVQVGFARTGDTFWAFQSQAVVPDIVAAAKAAGNGHPVGFVACRPEIAVAFERTSSYFSTPAGSPVSCRIGQTVIEVITEEKLQDNASEVGSHIADRLRDMSHRHPVIGAVHGRGLYQGIDLVCAPGSTDALPAEQVAAICERLRELGCIVAPTGAHGNVLKVKPPLCLTREQADRFLSALDRVLTERGRYLELSRPNTTTRPAGSEESPQ
ncbi:aminotransferase class III-fold pyridoxal phosphate-dependent enzyme [Mycolicibacterium neoaurum]|uniref:aminotransferase class III-fold pyridoxal phosphate-dependent enzyme n=1 Tax=Mycolicibacterium neoaurum TaxID=1795 RepID=UPI00267123F5|nr:aminotransferase class III-fold pyridoxal phosphate-dependent enzyme [Mycolicibacterium neoaurum]MDO3399575.1 aminotransferase class III-fold pyridoxal phosphate-dependent enzyme [Mycolicibacterium neoaurum]